MMEKQVRKGHWTRSGKRWLALLMCVCLIGTMIPVMPGGTDTVKAASGSGTEPRVSAYATKAQLMDGTFAPDLDGNATNIGKLVFGKNNSGASQEWYILGKDDGVSGDNTIIFAASPIVTGKKFSSSIDNKTDSNLWSDCTYGGGPVNEVFANHYGASNLRKELKTMATNTSYFTTAEQGLMNATTVTTKDTKNSNVTYTTTDKLYALQGDIDDNQYLWAGTSDSTVLAMNSYWSSGEYFWLRSPIVYFEDFFALLALPGCYVNGYQVNCEYNFQPASNLNLSSVLFASAATAASSETAEARTIADGTAMTLRLNGTGKNIGTVTYNATTGDIKVAKGSTSKTVALVVQGNDGIKDWYYSKQITGTEIVKESDIVAESNTPSSIDLSACKIWLEITDTDKMIYAVCADKEIEKINTTYVTKEQLMNSFSPYSNGTAVNYGKIVFGKKSDGATAQEWYILGKDEGVSGDNTIIFAASPIAAGQKFEDDYTSNKTFQSSFGVYASNPSEVYPNHYGASDLRVALQGMALNTNYFTTAEQGLMNDTTVTTKDTNNSSVTYTTTDKLYALQGDYDNDQYLWAGTSDSTVLAMNRYWSSGDRFWLRSPRDFSIDALPLLRAVVSAATMFSSCTQFSPLPI